MCNDIIDTCKQTFILVDQWQQQQRNSQGNNSRPSSYTNQLPVSSGGLESLVQIETAQGCDGI
ncbi:hypothetical protein D3C86_2112870 [compost metagenome]